MPGDSMLEHQERTLDGLWRSAAVEWLCQLTKLNPGAVWGEIDGMAWRAWSGAVDGMGRDVSEFMPPPQIVNEPIENDERTPSYVYAIQAESGWVKIGTTTSHPKSRMRSLQTGHPERLRLLCYFPGDRTIEGQIHRQLDDHRKHGEWFEPASLVLGGLWLWHNQFWESGNREAYCVDSDRMIL